MRTESAAAGEPVVTGLRDRALIGVMVYTFARVDAVLQMKVRDCFVRGRRGWVRLHEKGGKEHEDPGQHKLEQCLDEYLAGAPDGPLVPDGGRQNRRSHRKRPVATGCHLSRPAFETGRARNRGLFRLKLSASHRPPDSRKFGRDMPAMRFPCLLLFGVDPSLGSPAAIWISPCFPWIDDGHTGRPIGGSVA